MWLFAVYVNTVSDMSAHLKCFVFNLKVIGYNNFDHIIHFTFSNMTLIYRNNSTESLQVHIIQDKLGRLWLRG